MSAPARLPLWAKLLAVLAALLLVAVSATLVFGAMAWWQIHKSVAIEPGPIRAADPQEAQLRKAQADQIMLQAQTRPAWDAARAATTQLATDEGAKALYAADPALHEAYPGEAAFLAAVKDLRPRLQPLPEEPPLPSSDLVLQRSADGKLLIISWHPSPESWVRYFFQGNQLADLKAN